MSFPRRTPSTGRRTFGATWWGKAWIEALEHRARLDPNRLPRGRTYARKGRATGIELGPGEIRAAVSGSRPAPYAVRIRVRTFTDQEWDRVVEAICARAAHAAALLDGELDPGVVEDARSAGVEVLPGPGDLQPRCSCPDWADPCKHAAAVCYLVADELDADPFSLFAVRGRRRDDLLAAVRRHRAQRAPDDGGHLAAMAADARSDDPDPGIPAREAWARAALSSGESGARAALSSAESTTLPEIPAARGEPGAPAPWPVDPPADAPFTADGLRVLVADAAARAHAMLRDGASSGLALDADDDLSRRASVALGTDAWAPLVGRAGVPARQLVSRALAWRAAGPDGVAVLDQSPWPADPLVVSAGRRAMIEAGIPAADITARTNRVTAAAAGAQLRVAHDGRWWPFTKQRGRWELAGPPAETPDDALDSLPDR